MRWLICVLFLFAAANRAVAACPAPGPDHETLSPDIWRAAEARAAATPNAEGLLWRVSKPGAPASHLFGSFHTGEMDAAPAVAKALRLAAASRLTFIEMSEKEKAAMQTAMREEPGLVLNPEPAPLETWLSPDLVAIADAALTPLGVNAKARAMIRPWMLSLMLAMKPCELAERAARGGAMDDLIARAAPEVRGMEGWRDAMKVFYDQPLDRQRDDLRLTLAMQSDADATRASVIRLYARGRPMMIYELAVAVARNRLPDEDIDAEAAKMWTALVSNRNRNMAAAITPELERGGVLVVAGALHLPGEDGLVALLRARGFTVTRAD